jgi:hypothetical protein
MKLTSYLDVVPRLKICEAIAPLVIKTYWRRTELSSYHNPCSYQERTRCHTLHSSHFSGRAISAQIIIITIIIFIISNQYHH